MMTAVQSKKSIGFWWTILLMGLAVGSAADDASKFSPTRDASFERGFYVPEDLEAALTELKRSLSREELRALSSLSRGHVVGQYHRGLGSWMRHYWLYKDSRLTRYFEQFGIESREDASAIVLEALWRTLNDEGASVEELASGLRLQQEIKQPPRDLACPEYPQVEMTLVHSESKPMLDSWLLRVKHFAICGVDQSYWVYEHGRGWSRATPDDVEAVKRYRSTENSAGERS